MNSDETIKTNAKEEKNEVTSSSVVTCSSSRRRRQVAPKFRVEAGLLVCCATSKKMQTALQKLTGWCWCSCWPNLGGTAADEEPSITTVKRVHVDENGRRVVETKTVQRSLLRKKIVNRPDGSQDVVEELVTSGSGTSLCRDRPMTEDQFQKDSLAWHNYYRSLHGTPPLALCPKLNEVAKKWAQQLAVNDKFEHSPDDTYGENVYVKWSSNPNHQITGRDAVESWYSEIAEYRWNGQEPDLAATGHFTQLIWRDTTHVGTSFARSANNKILVVANYNPPGNVTGLFGQCVPPAIKYHT
ncbi:uncharacterized protein LOC135368027 [Ornithodoros turicata]|uniref:uncharacterized protein LOC135368027 n=1 Tax=Ornithodoros turicata TaxID=34597 RepID=UPI0031396B85